MINITLGRAFAIGIISSLAMGLLIESATAGTVEQKAMHNNIERAAHRYIMPGVAKAIRCDFSDTRQGRALCKAYTSNKDKYPADEKYCNNEDCED